MFKRNIQDISKNHEYLFEKYKNKNINSPFQNSNSISISKDNNSIINTSNSGINFNKNESIDNHLRRINNILNREDYSRNYNLIYNSSKNKKYNPYNYNDNKEINIENIKKKYLENYSNNKINLTNNFINKNSENNINRYINDQSSFEMNIIESYNNNIEPILKEIEKIKKKYLTSTDNQTFIQKEKEIKLLEEKLNRYKIELFKSIEMNNNNILFGKYKNENNLYQYKELNQDKIDEMNIDKINSNNEENKEKKKINIIKNPLKESLNNDTIISFNISEDSEMINSKMFQSKNLQKKEDKEFNYEEVLPLIEDVKLKTIKEEQENLFGETKENFFNQDKDNINEIKENCIENKTKTNEDKENLNENKDKLIYDLKENKKIELNETKKQASEIAKNIIEAISDKLIQKEENENIPKKDIKELINDDKKENQIKPPNLIGDKNNKIQQPKLLSKNNSLGINKEKKKILTYSEFIKKNY